jgi:c-di-GMP-binding flagellar brake protein YcgR
MTIEKQSGEVRSPQKQDFESMNLLVGTRLQLFTHRHIKPVQHFSMLIGYVKDEYLLVKIPFENGAYMTLHDGEKVTVRVFSGTSICSFAATVTRSFLQPFFYAHLSFPSTIESTSLRTAMRAKVDLTAEVTRSVSGANSSVMPVSLSNLSVAGALIESRQELGSVGQMIDLAFTPLAQHSDHEVRISTQATIRNISLNTASSAEEQDAYMYGVQFTDLSLTNLMILQNLTYEALLAGRQNIV